MKIGIDARLLSLPITGIGRYTLEICRSLSTHSELKLFLYSPKCFNEDLELESAATKHLDRHCGAICHQLWTEFVLPKWMREDGIDVFWAPTQRLPIISARRIPSVITIHDLVWKYAGDTMRKYARPLSRYYISNGVKNASIITTISNSTKQQIVKVYNTNDERVVVVPCGVDQKRQHGKRNLPEEFAIHKPYCLFVGTIEPRKNLQRLLVAFSKLPQSVRENNLLVIAGGEGWGCVDLASLITKLNLSSCVQYLGYVDDKELASLYSQAEFLAMPSLYEGFGLPIIESMSYGTPVLTSNTSSMPEVGGDAALYVNPLDISSIKIGLERLFTDESLKRELSLKCTVNIRKYTWESSARRLAEVFRRAVRNPSEY